MGLTACRTVAHGVGREPQRAMAAVVAMADKASWRVAATAAKSRSWRR